MRSEQRHTVLELQSMDIPAEPTLRLLLALLLLDSVTLTKLSECSPASGAEAARILLRTWDMLKTLTPPAGQPLA